VYASLEDRKGAVGEQAAIGATARVRRLVVPTRDGTTRTTRRSSAGSSGVRNDNFTRPNQVDQRAYRGRDADGNDSLAAGARLRATVGTTTPPTARREALPPLRRRPETTGRPTERKSISSAWNGTAGLSTE